MSVASMVINLLARTESFEKGFKRAGKEVESLSKQINKFNKNIGIGAKAFTYAKITSNVLDSVASYISATNDGKDATAEFMETAIRGIPMVGNAFYNLIDALSQVDKKTLDAMESFNTYREAVVKAQDDILEIQMFGINKTDEDAAFNEYQKKVSSIDKLVEKQIELKASDEEILKMRETLETKYKEEYDLKIKLINASNAEKSNAERLKEEQKVLESVIDLEKERDRAKLIASGVSSEMASLLEKQKEIPMGIGYIDARNRIAALIKELEIKEKQDKLNKEMIEDDKEAQKIREENIAKEKERAEAMVKTKEAKSLKSLDSGEFKQINSSDISVKGLAIRSGTEMYQQQIAKNTAKTAENTGKTTGALV